MIKSLKMQYSKVLCVRKYCNRGFEGIHTNREIEGVSQVFKASRVWELSLCYWPPHCVTLERLRKLSLDKITTTRPTASILMQSSMGQMWEKRDTKACDALSCVGKCGFSCLLLVSTARLTLESFTVVNRHRKRPFRNFMFEFYIWGNPLFIQ